MNTNTNRKNFNTKVPESGKQNYIVGRNAVIEALKSGRTIECIYVAEGEKSGSLRLILALAKENHITIKRESRKKLDFLTQKESHQGVVAVVGAKAYCTVDDILNYAQSKGELPFVVVCDGIEDPHNLGAIIRTAECAGVHGIIIPSRRAVGLTEGVDKSASGALEYVRVSKVTNTATTLEYLKSKGLWIYGADISGKPVLTEDFTGALAIVIGSEGKGVSHLVKEKCDFVISLPMFGKINSLNASVAAGILMYDVCRARQ